ncbi:hypothetical protein [Pareuzebyella sediminis]|nr:hypothetical protein [Pareuzebyella sediminis]
MLIALDVFDGYSEATTVHELKIRTDSATAPSQKGITAAAQQVVFRQ